MRKQKNTKRKIKQDLQGRGKQNDTNAWREEGRRNRRKGRGKWRMNKKREDRGEWMNKKREIEGSG